ncbi:MAG TPA: DNA primase [Arcobacter sp.]|jgi:DNA primase|nr:DNA primase [Arcobacter sp.]
MISKHSIENLKNQLDVVDVVGNYITLKKSGANFKACCPFHGEKTPSLVVSPTKQIFHCFGCGIGGDSIKFVMEYEKLSYPESIEKLASQYNVSLDYENNQKQQDFSIMEKVNDYYKRLLDTNKVASDYIKNRGISSFSVEKFELGFAPNSNDTINFMKSNFLNLSDAKDFGLIDNGHNGLYARFIDRITFPIYSASNKIVGFGGRTISGHQAKYINSPQTKYFNKSRLLYGYNIAKEKIYKQKQIIITEGYLDVIMLHQAGFETAVATLGTALTNDHVPLINKGEPKIILAYDGDKAGQNAAYKASVILSQNKLEGGVVLFSDGQDPADMVNSGQIEELNRMFLNPTSFSEYVIDFIIKQYDTTNPNQKQKALDETQNYLNSLTPIMQQSLAPKIAMKLDIPINLLGVKSDISKFTSNKNIKVAQVDIGELSILKTLLEHDAFYEEFKGLIYPHLFLTHGAELEVFLQNPQDESLRSIFLQDEVKVYSKEELKSQLMRILVPYYNKQLQLITINNELDFKDKSRKIRALKDNIVAIKRGDFKRVQNV